MEDIFEFTWFYYWDLFEKSSFFIVFFLLIFYFILKKIFLKKGKKTIKREVLEEENINFLEELDKIKNQKLKKYLGLFAKFLEKKYKNFEFSKMSFSEIEKIKIEENEKQLFKKIYFLVYSWEKIEKQILENIFLELLSLFEKNL